MKNYLYSFQKILLFSFLFFINQQYLSAQENKCSTPHFDTETAQEKYLASLQSEGPFFVKIYFHSVRKNDGTGGQDVSDILEAFTYLENDYDSLNIFFVWDGCIDFIDSTQFYNFPNTDLFDINDHADGIDIYLLNDDINVIGRSAAPFLPNQTKTAFMLGGNDDGILIAKSHVISHEMGHSFNLFHTHVGCNSTRLEALDGSNCDTAGDLVCDTPPDPGLANVFVDTSCNWVPGFQVNGQDVYAACREGLLGNLPLDVVLMHEPQFNNIMNDFRPICYEIFTPGQGQRMRNAIAGLPILQPVQSTVTTKSTCFCTEDEDMIVDGNQFIETSRAINGNIIIKPGGVLHVSADLFFAPDKSILVEKGGKLIVENGKLTKCPFSENWKGVIVEGNPNRLQTQSPGIDDSGVVLTKNARIEYTEIGISSTAGGLVICENTVFQENEIGVRIAGFERFANQSRFDGCEFYCKNIGAELSKVYDLSFQQSKFFNVNIAGIVSENAGFSVKENCHFENNNQGINAEQKSARFGKVILIENSFFVENAVGISVEGIRDLTVSTNQFEGNEIGLMIEGDNSQYAVRGNSFINHKSAVWLRTTGNNDNRLNCNYYENFENGLLIWGNNSGFRFDFEEFVSVSDSEISTNVLLQGFRNNHAVIDPIQRAKNGRPLSNRFSGNRKIISNTNSAFGFTEPFIYYAPAGEENLVFVPECSLELPLESECSPNNYTLYIEGNPQNCPESYIRTRSKNDFATNLDLILVPNPASNEVTVEIPSEFSTAKLQVLNLLRQPVFELSDVGGERQKISLENFSGVHFVRLTNPDGRHLTAKLLIQ